MSICRFSSDNWKSDVYCYEEEDGTFTTHVASKRVCGDPPKVVVIGGDQFSAAAWVAMHAEQMKWLKSAEYEKISGRHDGATFSDASVLDLANRLEMLAACGYHIPPGLIEMLRKPESDADHESAIVN